MKSLALMLILGLTSFGATYRGVNIDGRKYTATTRINGAVVPVTVRFDGRGVEVWLGDKILPMKLADEVVDDLNSVTVYDGKREYTLRVDLE